MGRRQARSRGGSALAGAVQCSQNCSFVQKMGGQTTACLHPACGHHFSGAGRRWAALSPWEAAGAGRASLPARLSCPASHHQLGVGKTGMTGTGWWGQECQPGKYLLLPVKLSVQLLSNLACSSPEGF